MKIWMGYCRTVRKLSRVSAYIASVVTLVMSALIFVEVICRSFFGFSTLIADEFGGYFLCASTFFAGPILMADDGFLRVDVAYLHFRGAFKKICDLLIWGTALIFCGYLFYFCLHVVQSSLNFNTVSAYVSKTPMVYPQSVMLIGLALLILEVIVKLGEVFVPGVDNQEQKAKS